MRGEKADFHVQWRLCVVWCSGVEGRGYDDADLTVEQSTKDIICKEGQRDSSGAELFLVVAPSRVRSSGGMYLGPRK